MLSRNSSSASVECENGVHFGGSGVHFGENGSGGVVGWKWNFKIQILHHFYHYYDIFFCGYYHCYHHYHHHHHHD